jgi:hypothetical protein
VGAACWNPSTWGGEAEDPDFEAGQDCIWRACLKTKQNKTKKANLFPRNNFYDTLLILIKVISKTSRIKLT